MGIPGASPLPSSPNCAHLPCELCLGNNCLPMGFNTGQGSLPLVWIAHGTLLLSQESACDPLGLGCFKRLPPPQFRWLEISHPVPNPPNTRLGNQATPASKGEGGSFSFI